MKTTEYGLSEGLMMVAPMFIFVFFLTFYKFMNAADEDRQKVTALGGLAYACIILDTLMWAFDIETGIIDFKMKNGEQMTIYVPMLYVAIIMLIRIPRKKGDINC